MASTMTLKDRLDIAAKDAEAAQEKITSGTLGREAFRQEVRNYTLAKFFLTEDEVRALGTEDILKLADESVEKLLRQNDKSVKLAEGSTTCTNQSSTDIKKVLLSLTLQRDGHCESRNTVQEVGGAVERINNPAMLAVCTFNRAAFFHQKAIVRTRTAQFTENNVFCFFIRLAHIIARAFKRNLQILYFAEITRQ